MLLKQGFAVLFFMLCFVINGQTNRSLIVAIDTYPTESGWTKIHATNDIKLVLPVLQKSGYPDKNIKTLLNEQATKETIVNSLKTMAAETTKGDFIYIHFSCHGQQMFDDNGDEEDGLDEAIIPYDAKRRYMKGVYEGENHLRDDELEKLLEKIRLKAGPAGNVTVVIDACHSGTATREGDDDTYVRGTTYIFAPENYNYDNATPENISLNLKVSPKLAPINVFSACQADELNYEFRDKNTNEYYGTLSYAFSKLVSKSKSETNIQFYQKLVTEMNAMSVSRRRVQTPHYESTNKNSMFKIGKTQ